MKNGDPVEHNVRYSHAVKARAGSPSDTPRRKYLCSARLWKGVRAVSGTGTQPNPDETTAMASFNICMLVRGGSVCRAAIS